MKSSCHPLPRGAGIHTQLGSTSTAASELSRGQRSNLVWPRPVAMLGPRLDTCRAPGHRQASHGSSRTPHVGPAQPGHVLTKPTRGPKPKSPCYLDQELLPL